MGSAPLPRTSPTSIRPSRFWLQISGERNQLRSSTRCRRRRIAPRRRLASAPAVHACRSERRYWQRPPPPCSQRGWWDSDLWGPHGRRPMGARRSGSAAWRWSCRRCSPSRRQRPRAIDGWLGSEWSQLIGTGVGARLVTTRRRPRRISRSARAASPSRARPPRLGMTHQRRHRPQALGLGSPADPPLPKEAPSPPSATAALRPGLSDLAHHSDQGT